MRPKPLIPTRTGMMRSPPGRRRTGSDRRLNDLPPGLLTLTADRAERHGPSVSAPPSPLAKSDPDAAPGARSAARELVDVAVGDLDEVVAALGVELVEVLGDDDRAVPAARAADGDVEVGLPLLDVARQQVVQQRDEALVERVELAAAVHELDDLRVAPRERPQVGDVVWVGQEADVEAQVGVARRSVLVAEAHERHRE